MFKFIMNLFKRKPHITEDNNHMGCGVLRLPINEAKEFGIKIIKSNCESYLGRLTAVDGDWTLALNNQLDEASKNYVTAYLLRCYLCSWDKNCEYVYVSHNPWNLCQSPLAQNTRCYLIEEKLLNYLLEKEKVFNPIQLAECFNVPVDVLVERLRDLDWLE